jgi:hypothetical protein
MFTAITYRFAAARIKMDFSIIKRHRQKADRTLPEAAAIRLRKQFSIMQFIRPFLTLFSVLFLVIFSTLIATIFDEVAAITFL